MTMTLPNLIEQDDDDLSAALHFIEAHEDDLDDIEMDAWKIIKPLICRQADEAYVRRRNDGGVC